VRYGVLTASVTFVSLHEGDGIPYKLHGGYLLCYFDLVLLFLFKSYLILRGLFVETAADPSDQDRLCEVLQQWHIDLGQPLPCTSDSFVHILYLSFPLFHGVGNRYPGGSLLY